VPPFDIPLEGLTPVQRASYKNHLHVWYRHYTGHEIRRK
jgi:hypothetical protein